jgi:CRP-like cAMP-binding protein
MYFIAKGDCQVIVRDEKRNENPIKILKEGDHFGEISMIYKCRRTATVILRNYNTMAKLEEARFRELVGEFPEYMKHLRMHMQTYKDRMKKFMVQMAMRVPYITKVSADTMHDIIYSLKPKQYEKGTVLYKPEDDVTSVLFIQEGVVELFTYFEGNEFVIERLYRGSVLNFRAFFMDDLMYVYVRCAKATTVLEFENNTIEFTKVLRADFEKDLLQF